MADIILSEDQIATSTDRDLLEKHMARLLRSGTEPGWIESYWVHTPRSRWRERVSFHGNRYRQRVYRDRN